MLQIWNMTWCRRLGEWRRRADGSAADEALEFRLGALTDAAANLKLVVVGNVQTCCRTSRACIRRSSQQYQN